MVEILEATTGGARTHILQLLRGLSAMGFEMTLIASAERDAGFRAEMARLDSEGITVIEVPMRRRITPLSDPAALFRLRSLLRKLEYDVVHTHASKAGVLGRLAAWMAGARRVIHTPHTFYFEALHGIGRWCFRTMEWALLGFTRRLIVLSQGQRRLAIGELGAKADRVALIENGVDAAHFAPQGLRDESRRTLGIPLGAPVVGTIARLRPQKGCDLFLKAAARVVEELPAARFVIVGKGPLRDRLMELAEQLQLSRHVIWRDEADDVRLIYEALDVFALASRYEGMPYTLLEAMAMGLPVVAGRIPGCEEVVSESTGLLVPPDRPGDLARAITGLLRNRTLARQMGAAGRALAEERFSLKAALERIAGFYREMAASDA